MKEEVIKLLNNEVNALTLIEINDLLALKTPAELKELDGVLKELITEHILYHTKKDKYILYKNVPNFKLGPLTVNAKGFGFVLLKDEPDVYIGSTHLNGAIHGDEVLCEIINDSVKREGRILKIIKRNLDTLVGEVIFKDRKAFLIMADARINLVIQISKETSQQLVEGHKVFVKIRKQINTKKYLCDVIKILGHKNDPGVDILTIAYQYGIKEGFDSKVLAELASIPSEVTPTEFEGRQDLTKKEIFTIDGDDTKDIDDAISLDLIGDNYLLGVHIADVSHYLKVGSHLFGAAQERGTSSYLADTVIPMIPHQLSNGICSLNPEVLRLALSCEMLIDQNGNVKEYNIFPSVIKSKKQMTYKKVNDLIERNIVNDDYEPYKKTLLKMQSLSDILRKAKDKRGFINFELDEAKVFQDKQGRAIDVVKRERGRAELIIEDFMIVANETVARAIYHMDLPFIYRTHGEPSGDKINDFMNLVNILGYNLTGQIKDLKPKSMQNLLTQLNGKKEFKILSSLLLRSMAKAEYTKDNSGHFGLASSCYTHFTSPIRRFPDLIVHTLLRKYLFEADLSKNTINYYSENLAMIAANASEREVAAISAERAVLDMKKAEYMESHIGEYYTGIITDITNFGMFVELDNLVEGLVHVNSLQDDFFEYIPERLSLVGKATKKTYRLGQTIKIRVINASKINATVDFAIIGDDNG